MRKLRSALPLRMPGRSSEVPMTMCSTPCMCMGMGMGMGMDMGMDMGMGMGMGIGSSGERI